MQCRQAELKEDRNDSDQTRKVWKNLCDANIGLLSLEAYFVWNICALPEFAISINRQSKKPLSFLIESREKTLRVMDSYTSNVSPK